MEKLIYDKSSYEKHLAEIARLEDELTKVKNELVNADARVTDGWLVSETVTILQQRARRISTKLHALKSKNIEVLDNAQSENNKVTLGKVYNLHVSYSNGRTNDLIVRLVAAFPQFGVDGKIDELTIMSPMGKAIHNGEVGNTYDFLISPERGEKIYAKVKVVEEVKISSANEEQEEM